MPSRIANDEIIREQAVDSFCQEQRAHINAGSPVPFAEHQETGILVRTAAGHPQLVVPYSMRARNLNKAHCTRIGAHAGGRKMYKALRLDYYWPTMAVDVFATVHRCPACAH